MLPIPMAISLISSTCSFSSNQRGGPFFPSNTLFSGLLWYPPVLVHSWPPWPFLFSLPSTLLIVSLNSKCLTTPELFPRLSSLQCLPSCPRRPQMVPQLSMSCMCWWSPDLSPDFSREVSYTQLTAQYLQWDTQSVSNSFCLKQHHLFPLSPHTQLLFHHFPHSILSLNKYPLSTCYGPGTVLGAETLS